MRIECGGTVALAFCVAIPVMVAAEALAADASSQFGAVAEIFENSCIRCHSSTGAMQGEVALNTYEEVFGADAAGVIRPGEPDRSRLVQMISGPEPRMPEHSSPLSEEQVEAIRRWIAAGAAWPDRGRELQDLGVPDANWWSFEPLEPVALPQLSEADAAWVRTPIDAFVIDKLREQGMQPSEEADRRTLIRRVFFDLIGLPPTPEQVEAFVADDDPQAYEKLVDELLASPHYGERWARHWMDIASFAESHGHDEDVPRENAWPYRDYLVRAFNEGTAYGEFIEQQIAGDVLYPDDPWAIAALGFLAAGPWDQSSQMGIVDGTEDKLIAQVIDRDEMISAAVGGINSLTVDCARCHTHKFDPISQSDYYALQAVFAGVDRVDVPFDPDPAVHQRRRELEQRGRLIAAMNDEQLLAGDVQQQVAAWEQQRAEAGRMWHTLSADAIETSEGSSFEKLEDDSILFSGGQERDVYTITAASGERGITAVRLEILTHPDLPEQGPGRAPNGNLHLSEFRVLAAKGEGGEGVEPKPVAIAHAFASFNQDGWTIEHALDGTPGTAWGIFPQTGMSHEAVFVFDEPVDAAGGRLTVELHQNHGGAHLIGRPRLSVTTAKNPAGLEAPPTELAELLAVDEAERTPEQRAELARAVLAEQVEQELRSLPERQMVYAVATDFDPLGNFQPAEGPRPVHVLDRGDINQPLEPAEPGAIAALDNLPARFDLDDAADEGERRAALARWLSDERNVLTWRSIVNRVWHWHFGRGIAATPDDFGRMGAEPSHPQLLDWLAVWFRDEGGQSLKQLHRMIVTSATYRQASTHNSDYAARDAENAYLWRMNRHRLAAEQVTDAVLAVSGTLDRTMGGPSVRQFVQSPGVHETPEVDYQAFDPDDPANHRRAVYRFHMRTLPDPLMESLDCPTGSQATPVRGDSVTPLQALAMMNSPFMIRQAEHFADRVADEADGLDEQVRQMYQLALQREPGEGEQAAVADYAAEHGLAAAARLIFNTNDFMFID